MTFGIKGQKEGGFRLFKGRVLGGKTAEKGKKYSISVRVCKTENSFTMRLLSPLYGFLSSLKIRTALEKRNH